MKFTILVVIFASVLTSALFISSLIQQPDANAATTRTLTVQSANSNAGQNLPLVTITSTPAGINCGQGNTQCSAQFEEGSKVTLTGNVMDNKSDIAFQWKPITAYFHGSPNYTVPYLNCDNMDSAGYIEGKTCSAPMPTSDVTIQFAAAYTHSPITVQKAGTGTGTVANQNPVKPPLIINCGTLCNADISSSLILFAIPDAGSVFAGWNINGGSSADCGPTNYAGKCLSSYQVNVRGDGGSDTYIAVFNKATTATSNTEPAKQNTPLQAPDVTITIDGKTIAGNDKPILNSNQSIVLSGTTIVGGSVNIYTFPGEETATTIANKDGNWTFTVPLKKLTAGNHHIEVDVTDLASDTVSDHTQALAFEVSENVTTNGTTIKKANKILSYIIPVSLIVMAICASLIALYIRKHRLGKKQVGAGTKPSRTTKDKKKPVNRKAK